MLFFVGGGEIRRGRTLFFHDSRTEKAQKAMVVDLTPRKKHVKISTKSNEKLAVIPLQKIIEPPPRPLDGQVFVISGNTAERGEKKKLNIGEVSSLILNNGGSVYNGDIERAVDADFILITSQKEFNKEHSKLNKAVVMAYRLGWPIVSKKYILDADKSKECPNLNNYKLMHQSM